MSASHKKAGYFSKMFDWDGCLLKVVYYYGFLVGISNFEVDWSTCRVFKTKRSTIFAFLHNVLALVLVIFYWKGRISFNVLFDRANKLHEYVVVIMSGLRVSSGKNIIQFGREAAILKCILFRAPNYSD